MGSRQAVLYRRCWLYTSLVAGTLYLGFHNTHGVDALAVGLPQPVGIWALVIPPHFIDRPTLAVDGFIDIVGHNWPETPKLRTPLRKTVVQRGLPPRWPQLSQVAWAGEKCKGFSGDKEALSGNTDIRAMIKAYVTVMCSARESACAVVGTIAAAKKRFKNLLYKLIILNSEPHSLSSFSLQRCDTPLQHEKDAHKLKNEVSEGLEIQLSFPCGTEDAVPVCLI